MPAKQFASTSAALIPQFVAFSCINGNEGSVTDGWLEIDSASYSSATIIYLGFEVIGVLVERPIARVV